MVERSPKILASEQKSHHTTLPCYFVVTKRSTTCSLPRGSNQGKTKFINSQVSLAIQDWIGMNLNEPGKHIMIRKAE